MAPPVRLRLLLLACLLPAGLNAQLRCGFDAWLASQSPGDPRQAARLAAEQTAWEAWLLRPAPATRAACEVWTIPVVFHVVYQSPAGNLSDAQLLSQIAVMNEDFRRIPGSPGYGPGTDTRIQFCLATLDPQGQASTGITRQQSPLAVHTRAQEAQLKQFIAWDDQRYLNIWVVESITDDNQQSLLGYASFPTFPNELPQGIVVRAGVVSRGGSAQPPFDKGRTLTHEAGHFLGLYHPFESEGTCAGSGESTCLSAGDRVCDTPAQLEPASGCPGIAPNTCPDQPCDGPDPLHNYLNTTDDACMNHFTAGQAARMHFFLSGARASLVDPVNVLAAGCTIGSVPRRPEAGATRSAGVACIGESLTFADASEGCPDQWSWHFPGGIPAQSNQESPVVTYPLPGSYEVRLVVANEWGSDTLIWPDAVRCAAAVQAGDWEERFEPGAFPPQGWQTEAPAGSGSWEISPAAAKEGSGSLVFPHDSSSSSCGQWHHLISPPLELSGRGWELSLWIAYQARNSSFGDADELQIAVSDACGAPWQTLWTRAGAGLATVPGFAGSAPFVPGPADWQEIRLDLVPFAASTHLRIRLSTFGRNGQRLYLDDVQLRPSGSLAAEKEGPAWALAPNPSSGEITLRCAACRGKRVEVCLTDGLGREVAKESLQANAAGEVWWNPEVPAGLYALRIETGGRIEWQQVLRLKE